MVVKFYTTSYLCINQAELNEVLFLCFKYIVLASSSVRLCIVLLKLTRFFMLQLSAQMMNKDLVPWWRIPSYRCFQMFLRFLQAVVPGTCCYLAGLCGQCWRINSFVSRQWICSDTMLSLSLLIVLVLVSYVSFSWYWNELCQYILWCFSFM